MLKIQNGLNYKFSFINIFACSVNYLCPQSRGSNGQCAFAAYQIQRIKKGLKNIFFCIVIKSFNMSHESCSSCSTLHFKTARQHVEHDMRWNGLLTDLCTPTYSTITANSSWKGELTQQSFQHNVFELINN